EFAESLRQNYRPAQIGRSQSARLEQSVRSDKILWLDNLENPAVNEYLQAMEAIRQEVNRRCFLGLFDYECHFARFEAGDFYKTHLDAFADEHNPRGNRKLSSVFYLNQHWHPVDGGELVIYAPNSGEEIARVLPELGTLVLFWSEEFPHEVLPARRARQSLTGWFRTRPQGV
ncbi:MAG TPA: 2OG-Fe(II) oxygenase, partial [Cellvibrionaceae bacterium]|nr:2OG-Fe(II) oxygenase [Cellvibrionaceae bacterium]